MLTRTVARAALLSPPRVAACARLRSRPTPEGPIMQFEHKTRIAGPDAGHPAVARGLPASRRDRRPRPRPPRRRPPKRRAAPRLADDAPPEGVLHAYVWECDGDLTLDMQQPVSRGRRHVDLHEGPRKLPLVVSALGREVFGRRSRSGPRATPPRSSARARRRSNVAKCGPSRSLADARVRGVRLSRHRQRTRLDGRDRPRRRGCSSSRTYGEERHEFGDATVAR